MRHSSSSVQPNVVPSQKTTGGVKSMWTTPIRHQVTITRRERKHRQTLTTASHLSFRALYSSTPFWTGPVFVCCFIELNRSSGTLKKSITLTASQNLKKVFHLMAEYIELSINLFNIILPLIYYKIVYSEFCQIAYLVLNPNHLRKKKSH